MKNISFHIVFPLFLVFVLGCGTDKDDRKIHDRAVHIANDLDTASLALLRQYNYVRRGPLEFWSRESEGTTLYSISYKDIGDTEELTLSKPFGFKKDFPTSFLFDTSHFYQFRFLRVRDSIVKLKMEANDGQEFYKEIAIASKNVFPTNDPFTAVKKLNNLKDNFGFVGTWYRSDIGDFINFWLTPYDKLIYMPDTNRLNPKFKRAWIDEFLNGKEIKSSWRLVRVKTNT